MDNQFNQSGGMPPQFPGGQPGNPAANPGMGQSPYAAPVGSPYEMLSQQENAYAQPPYGAPANPYDALNQPAANPAAPYGQMPYAAPANPYDALNQPAANPAAPYGQMPYAAPATPYDALNQPAANPAAPYGQTPYAAPGPYDTQNQPVANAAPLMGVQQPYQDPGASQPPYGPEGYQRLFTEGQPGAEQTPAPRGKAFAGAEAPQGLPGRKKRLSRSDAALIVVAALAVVISAIVIMVMTYNPNVARYGEVETGNLSAVHQGSCLIVRNEVPFDAESVNSIVYVAEEGGRVSRNSLICKIYSIGYSASAVRQLQQYRDEIRDYQKDKIQTDTIYDAKTERYNTEILTLAKEVRSIFAGDDGSLSNIETQLQNVVAERQTYLDSKYAADQRFSRIKDDELSQTQRINSWTESKTASRDALVSFYSDGYEYAVNAENYTTFEPEAVRRMINGTKPSNATPPKGATTLYRLVQDGEWYVLFLSNYTEWNPVVGEVYKLQLERFGDAEVDAEVMSFTKSGGELLVRLRVQGSVENILYLRSCNAVLSESMNTLRVHKRALYEQDGMVGVVVVEGSTESFIAVEVIHEEDDYVYFQTVQQGLLFEGMKVRLFD